AMPVQPCDRGLRQALQRNVHRSGQMLLGELTRWKHLDHLRAVVNQTSHLLKSNVDGHDPPRPFCATEPNLAMYSPPVTARRRQLCDRSSCWPVLPVRVILVADTPRHLRQEHIGPSIGMSANSASWRRYPSRGASTITQIRPTSGTTMKVTMSSHDTS